MPANEVKIALIGVGRWGAHVARELAAAGALVAYAREGEGPAQQTANVPRLSIEEIGRHPDIHAVWIATPIETHADIARSMLEAGKHVMCEKPLALHASEASALAALAQKKNLTLATGYVFLHHPVYRALKQSIAHEEIQHVECIWNKYGTFSESIEMNLLTHHLSIAYDLLGMPESGSYTSREAGETPCDKLDTVLVYKNASFVSRIDRMSKSKEHRITVHTQKGIVYEWQDNALKKDGAVTFESSEQPLACEVQEFLASLSGGVLTTSGRFGAEILRMHELLAQ